LPPLSIAIGHAQLISANRSLKREFRLISPCQFTGPPSLSQRSGWRCPTCAGRLDSQHR
jgi:hypothetical protein